jgi:putative endonuclease
MLLVFGLLIRAPIAIGVGVPPVENEQKKNRLFLGGFLRLGEIVKLKDMHVVYILYSSKLERNYIGYTSDLEVRLEYHKTSNADKFTGKAQDWVLLHKIDCQSKAQGLAIEKHIKSMKSKSYIQNLILYPEMTEKLLLKYDC